MIKEVDVNEASERCNAGAVLIDVRTDEETELGRPEGSLCIPLDDLPEQFGSLDPAAETYLICRSGRRSLYAAEFLEDQGFEKVFNVAGGYLAWSAAKLPKQK